MQLLNRQIQRIAIFIGLCGILYFLGLIVSAPMWLIWTGLGVAAIVLVLQKNTDYGEEIKTKRRAMWLSWVILAIGMGLLTNRCYYIVEVHGGWDAWAMWNYKARAMTDPHYWSIFLDRSSTVHSDYPLMLPGINALFLRTLGPASTEMVPYLLTFGITLLIPVWIFARLAHKQLLAASVVLLLFATSDAYLFQGVSQYADVLLGFFFLGAITAMEATRKSGAPAQLKQCGFFWGGCLWTKNEGVLLCTVAILYWLPYLLRARGLRPFLVGAALPLLTWGIFKIGWPMPNDMLTLNTSSSKMALLSDGSRYAAIWDGLKALMTGPFFWVQIIFWQMAGLCLLRRRWPAQAFFLVLSCLAVYSFIYVITPHDLPWHLATSQLRLLFQLIPAFVYSIVATMLSLQEPDDSKSLFGRALRTALHTDADK